MPGLVAVTSFVDALALGEKRNRELAQVACESVSNGIISRDPCYEKSAESETV